MRRRFNGSERTALWLNSDGHCEGCGRKLAKGFHADHVVPFSAGGHTDVLNGQALCPDCNLSKGNKQGETENMETGKRYLDIDETLRLGVKGRGLPPRNWQLRGIQDYFAALRKDYLLVGTPACGKTKWSGYIIRKMLDAGCVDRVVILAPTDQIKRQWMEDLWEHYEIDISHNWKNCDGYFPADSKGVAVTYHQVSQPDGPEVMRQALAGHRTIVIFDEIHHCGLTRSWGEGVTRAFDGMGYRLALSGTPFRTDYFKIPFIKYDDAGRCLPDFAYTYAEGVRDGVCRRIYFHRDGGNGHWREIKKGKLGPERGASFDDDLNAKDASALLSAILTCAEGKNAWIRGVLKAADSELREMRRHDHDAAGLVVAKDINHAKAIARIMRSMGLNPLVVVSKNEDGGLDPTAALKLTEFKKGDRPWLIAVKMVSEGVDIARLRVGVWATNCITLVNFRQVAGRFVRVQPENADDSACLFLPDDRRLREFAADMAQERDMMPPAKDLVYKEPEKEGDTPEATFEVISSELDFKGTIFGYNTFSPKEMADAERVGKELPNGRAIPVPEIALAFRLRDEMPAATATASAVTASAVTAPSLPPSEEKVKLRKICQTGVGKIAAKDGVEHKDVNAHLKRICGAGVARATLKQLKRRIIAIEYWHANGKPTDIDVAIRWHKQSQGK